MEIQNAMTTPCTTTLENRKLAHNSKGVPQNKLERGSIGSSEGDVS